MALPELDVAQVQRWCTARVPERARHQIRIECHLAPRQLTTIACRALWREDSGPEGTSIPIAGLRYTASEKSWTLYWRDRNLRFHRYDQMAPARHVEDLLTELDRDPTCIFCRYPPPAGCAALRRHDMGWVTLLNSRKKPVNTEPAIRPSQPPAEPDTVPYRRLLSALRRPKAHGTMDLERLAS